MNVRVAIVMFSAYGITPLRGFVVSVVFVFYGVLEVLTASAFMVKVAVVV